MRLQCDEFAMIQTIQTQDQKNIENCKHNYNKSQNKDPIVVGSSGIFMFVKDLKLI